MSHSRGWASMPRAWMCKASRELKVVLPLEEGPATTTTQARFSATAAICALTSARLFSCMVSACKATLVCPFALAATLHSTAPMSMARNGPKRPICPAANARRSVSGPTRWNCPGAEPARICQGTAASAPGAVTLATAGVRKRVPACTQGPLTLIAYRPTESQPAATERTSAAQSRLPSASRRLTACSFRCTSNSIEAVAVSSLTFSMREAAKTADSSGEPRFAPSTEKPRCASDVLGLCSTRTLPCSTPRVAQLAAAINSTSVWRTTSTCASMGTEPSFKGNMSAPAPPFPRFEKRNSTSSPYGSFSEPDQPPRAKS
mmetsp:Transcript_108183/g.304773  ORF Transcript_108183/g.304773 Transcript_108183/m.304773 type:complete len:318 (+) Transcript_108183:809-1762(+)